MVETTLTRRAFTALNEQRNSDAMNVAVNIGLLTKEKNTFTLPELGFKGERSLDKELQFFKLYDTKSKRVLFMMELESGSSPKILDFKRGGWENLLEKYVRENGTKSSPKEPKSELKLRHRARKSKN